MILSIGEDWLESGTLEDFLASKFCVFLYVDIYILADKKMKQIFFIGFNFFRFNFFIEKNWTKTYGDFLIFYRVVLN